MVPPDSARVPRAPAYSGTASARPRRFGYGAITRSGRPFQIVRLRRGFLGTCRVIPMQPYNPGKNRFGLLRVRSPLLTESQLMSVPGLLRWFTSPSVAPAAYFIRRSGGRITPAGLPHSEIRGSKDMCSSPRLIAAYHVLRRLAAPQASAINL